MESGVPEGVAQNERRSFRGVLFVARPEWSSPESRHTQQRKVLRRHKGDANLLRGGWFTESCLNFSFSSDCRKIDRTPFHGFEKFIRERRPRPKCRVLLDHTYQLAGVVYLQ